MTEVTKKQGEWGLRAGICVCIATVFPAFSAPRENKKVLPSYLQKAYVVQKDALIYSRPDFDATQITRIPAGAVVTISKKIYRPKSRFGTFYRIYIHKPKRIRAYVSEIDVVPRYIKSGAGFKLNPNFDQVKKKLKYVKDFQYNRSEPEDSLELGDTPISKMRLIGMTVSYEGLTYQLQEPSFWFFGLKLSGKGLPIDKIFTDINLMFSVSAPVIDGKQLERGYLLMADFLFKLPLFEVPHFLLTAGAGGMIKLKGASRPADPARSQVGAGPAGATALTLRVHDRLAILIEGKLYYDLPENKTVPMLSGGLLAGF